MAIMPGMITTQGILACSLLIVIGLLLLQSRRMQRLGRELTTATDALLDREQMATLGRLMSGIAHELNTPLGAVRCSVGTRQKAIAILEEVVAGLAEPDPDQAVLLARAEKALQALRGTDPVLQEAMTRTDLLVRELRLAGRGQADDPQPVDINELVRGALLLAGHELKDAVSVELDLNEVPPVPGWPGSLGQVLLNLVINGRQAAGTGGVLRIATEAGNGNVTITVSDNGPGLPAGDVEQIFKAGFSTKDKESGTGLGLFISRRIVTRHQGRLTAANGADGGAVFTVVLPTRRSAEGCGLR